MNFLLYLFLDFKGCFSGLEPAGMNFGARRCQSNHLNKHGDLLIQSL